MKGIPVPFVRANQWFLILFVALTLFTSLYTLLIVPLGVGIVALIRRKNPIFSLVRPMLKKPLSEYDMEDPEQQRFNQWIAVLCLFISLTAFTLGFSLIGVVFSVMVASAAAVALMGFCIGCFIRFQYIQLRHKLKRNSV